MPWRASLTMASRKPVRCRQSGARRLRMSKAVFWARLSSVCSFMAPRAGLLASVLPFVGALQLRLRPGLAEELVAQAVVLVMLLADGSGDWP